MRTHAPPSVGSRSKRRKRLHERPLRANTWPRTERATLLGSRRGTRRLNTNRARPDKPRTQCVCGRRLSKGPMAGTSGAASRWSRRNATAPSRAQVDNAHAEGRARPATRGSAASLGTRRPSAPPRETRPSVREHGGGRGRGAARTRTMSRVHHSLAHPSPAAHLRHGRPSKPSEWPNIGRQRADRKNMACGCAAEKGQTWSNIKPPPTPMRKNGWKSRPSAMPARKHRSKNRLAETPCARTRRLIGQV